MRSYKEYENNPNTTFTKIVIELYEEVEKGEAKWQQHKEQPLSSMIGIQ